MKLEYYDAKIDALEQKLDAMEAEFTLGADRAQAVIDVMNLMGKFVFYSRYGMYNRLLGFFADLPDISFEYGDHGLYTGREKISDYFHKYLKAIDGDGVGVLREHACCTPVVEVAADGKTAKGVWLSPGHEAIPAPQEGEGIVHAAWVYGRYGAEFVLQDGVWKIWHMQFFTTFAIGFYDTWAEEKVLRPWYEDVRGKDAAIKLAGAPSAPSTAVASYSPEAGMKNWPQPPKPYGSYEGTVKVVGAPPSGVKL